MPKVTARYVERDKPECICMECGRQFNSNRLVELHIKGHHGREGRINIKCGACGEKFKNHASYRRHCTERHNKPQFAQYA